jgi:hypothetical protein
MGFKKERLGPRLVAAARSGERYRDAHIFLGGTGAVGGTAVLQLLSMYEEMIGIHPPRADDVPVLVSTGTTADELAAFTRRLFRYVESRHGTENLPQRVRHGYLTHSGVFVALERFEVTPLPGLTRIGQTPPEQRRDVVAEFLHSIGATIDGQAERVFEALEGAVSAARPFSRFLERYRSENLEQLGIPRFRSVVLGIPIPSLVAYHVDDLAAVADQVVGLSGDHIDRLKHAFVLALRDDLVEVRGPLADEVLIAHTTGVGGMYDESAGADPLARPTTRLAFAHSALDRRLGDKARFARDLTDLYSEAGLKVLITAAAIGIDEVRVRERIPLHRDIRRRLFEAPAEVFPGSKGSQPAESKASRRAGRPAPAGHVIRVFRPLTLPFEDPGPGRAEFDRGDELIPSYAIRSGENGFFTVANADTLYRVMRVASPSELGLMLAIVALLGDDRLSPWFPGNVCYYDETDNARQVLDFLGQPPLLATQLSGAEPMALQDLGSAKHQGELHTLAMLILLHRLRTLDVDAIDPYVDVERFDPRAFLLAHSRVLAFEDLAAWEFEALGRDMQVLAGAEEPSDLLALTPPREHGLFPQRKKALERVLEVVLHAVWTPPSLGSPILFDRAGRTYLRTGYFVAPIDLLVTEHDAVWVWLRKAHAESGNPCSFEDYLDYHVSVGGFVDLRPHAIVCTAKNDEQDLTGKVTRFTDETALRGHLRSIEPYSFFSTCGLLAVSTRLRVLYGLLRESMIELGSLHEFRWHMPRDEAGHIIVVPGIVEALRMVSEGLEKTTGTERLDGIWGYERRPVPDRRGQIPGVS